MRDYFDELYNPKPFKLYQLKLPLFGKTFSVKFCIRHWVDWLFPVGLVVLPVGFAVYGWVNYGFSKGLILPIFKVMKFVTIIALFNLSLVLLFWVVNVILRVARWRLQRSGYTRITRNWKTIITTFFVIIITVFLLYVSKKEREDEERGYYEPSYDKVGW